jgi:quinoprotein glucose dehydrogenase
MLKTILTSSFRIATLILTSALIYHCKEKPSSYSRWETYRGTPDAKQYSDLNLIDTDNVHLLKPAWIYHTGDTNKRTTIECNPIIVGQRMYVTSPTLQLIALDAVTGKELWRFKPIGDEVGGGINRGVTYWKDNGEEYIFFPAGIYLYAVNANTGKLIDHFGDHGKIDMRGHLGKDSSTISISLTTPGILYQDILIIGSATGEGYDASPGHIRAYDARTGAFKWIFHTIPQPGEYGYDTWGWFKGENYGGTNNWGGMSMDEKKGIVYVSTGSPTYDFYGANRHGNNLFANCIIALDATNGKRLWHYQAVKHDIWDYDLPCAPTLATIPWQGKPLDILMQPTKMGELILLDRNTGLPLIKSDETPTPKSDVPGEQSYPTQSLNQGIKLVKQRYDTNALTTVSDTARAYALAQSRKYRFQGMYTPPSLIGTITQPGTRGGMEWGGLSFDPIHHMAYTNCNDFPMFFQLGKVRNKNENDKGEDGESIYLMNCAMCHGADLKGATGVPELTSIQKKYDPAGMKKIITKGKGLMPPHSQFTNEALNALVKYLTHFVDQKTEATNHADTLVSKYAMKGFKLFTDQEGFPASRPPWGTLNAVDIVTQKIKWSVPLGYYPKLKERGLEITGTQNFGGCVATAGGLIFIGATADELFRAFNVNTGKEVWSYKLPFGGYATPSVYEVNGREYIVIAAGGGNRNATPSGDVYIAFTLPQ